MSDKPGSVIGGMLLVTGSCVGAGMLGLPILTGLSGFFPSLVMFFCAWSFMMMTGLLVIEVNGWFSSPVNFISMVEKTLGRAGKGVSWVLYLSLFYALLIAYVAGSGSILTTMVPSIPNWMGSLFFVLLFGGVVFLGTRSVDLWNRVLMFFKIGAFCALVFLGAKHISPKLLSRTEPSYAIYALPLLITAFGFHNMIPSLTAYMKGDLKRVKKTIVGGSLLSLFIYLIWEILVLGIVPMQGASGILDSLKHDKEASQAIAGILGSSMISSVAKWLGFFAILTSFLAQSLSLVHFLADGLKVKKEKRENVGLCVLALAPPLIFAVVYPQLFFKALNFAGGVCAVILFGIIPVTMVWIGRYKKHIPSTYQVNGGRPLLFYIFGFALFVLFIQLSTMLGASYVKLG
ncbi:MAG: aromatic amino acid transport family protein [Chlamydiota bacterium]